MNDKQKSLCNLAFEYGKVIGQAEQQMDSYDLFSKSFDALEHTLKMLTDLDDKNQKIVNSLFKYIKSNQDLFHDGVQECKIYKNERMFDYNKFLNTKGL